MGAVPKSAAMLAILAPLMAGCNHGKPETGLHGLKIEAIAKRETEVVRFLNTCPVTNRETNAAQAEAAGAGALVAAALIPIAVDFTISAIRDYLDRIEKEKSAAYIASGAGSISKFSKGSDTFSFCIVVARGMVGPTPTREEGKPERESADDKKSRDTRNEKKLASEVQGKIRMGDLKQVGLADTPAFYLELAATVTKRKDVKAKANGAPSPVADLVLMPGYFQFARTAAKRGTDDEKSIGMVLVLRTTPAAEGADKTGAATGADAVFPLLLGKYKPGIEVVGPKGEKLQHPFSNLERTTPLLAIPDGLNSYASVTEASDPDKVLALISKTLEGKAKSLEEALSNAIKEAIKPAEPPK